MRCNNCGSPLSPGDEFCGHCGHRRAEREGYCPACGIPMVPGYFYCPNCGTPWEWNQSENPFPYGMVPRSRIVAGLLAVFFGSLGIHNFYLGYTNRGIAQLLLSTVGGILTCGLATAAVELWALLEAVLLFWDRRPLDGRGFPLRD